MKSAIYNDPTCSVKATKYLLVNLPTSMPNFSPFSLRQACFYKDAGEEKCLLKSHWDLSLTGDVEFKSVLSVLMMISPEFKAGVYF